MRTPASCSTCSERGSPRDDQIWKRVRRCEAPLLVGAHLAGRAALAQQRRPCGAPCPTSRGRSATCTSPRPRSRNEPGEAERSRQSWARRQCAAARQRLVELGPDVLSEAARPRETPALGDARRSARASASGSWWCSSAMRPATTSTPEPGAAGRGRTRRGCRSVTIRRATGRRTTSTQPAPTCWKSRSTWWEAR